jgi:hypothetical protein
MEIKVATTKNSILGDLKTKLQKMHNFEVGQNNYGFPKTLKKSINLF